MLHPRRTLVRHTCHSRNILLIGFANLSFNRVHKPLKQVDHNHEKAEEIAKDVQVPHGVRFHTVALSDADTHSSEDALRGNAENSFVFRLLFPSHSRVVSR